MILLKKQLLMDTFLLYLFFLMGKKNFYLNGYKILFDIIYNSKENLTILDHQINFKKRKHGKSKLDLKIVMIFIKQCIFTFKNKKSL